MPVQTRQALSEMRGAHNLWYVYSKKSAISKTIRSALLQRIEEENKVPQERYDFEDVLDECGFMYLQKLQNPSPDVENDPLWAIKFVDI